MQERYGTIYKGKKRLIDSETGEVVEVDQLYRKQTEGNFVKAYLSQLIMALDLVGGKKMKVVNYLLENVSLANNMLIKTNREIAKETGISYKTVADTLKLLAEANIIKRKIGAIMINPTLFVQGRDEKQRYLLIEFENFDAYNDFGNND